MAAEIFLRFSPIECAVRVIGGHIPYVKRLLLLPFALAACLAHAGSLTFDYKDPKGISAVSLTLDSMLEPIVGYAKGLSGTLQFDPAHPEKATGKIAVDVSSIQFANDGYTATAQGYALNGKKWPQLTLAIRKVESVKKVSSTRYEGTVLADFTCRGVTKPKRLTVSASYFPGKAEERTNGQHKGDLLILRTHFTVSRRDHGISEGIPDDLVGDNVEVGVAVVGIHYAEEPKLNVEQRWEVEAGDRDDPVLLQVERSGSTLRFRSGEKVVDAKVLARTADRMEFQLEPNEEFGPVKGELLLSGERGNGLLHLKEGDLRLRGRAVREFTSLKEVDLKGSGFTNFDLPKKMREAGTSGMAVARIADHKILETGHFGVVRAGEEAPVDASTLFMAGTMGHPVLQVAALKLAALGKLDLDQPANVYLKEDAIPAGPKGWGDRVTVRDLMTGKSGLPFVKFAGYAPDAAIPSLRASLGNLEVTLEPGTAEMVSSTNDALLEIVVAKASGQTVADFVRESIFAPLGMRLSTYAAHPPTAAAGHYSGGQPTFDPYHVYPAACDSGLWTNADEFGAFLVELGKLIAGMPNLLLAEEDRPLLAKVDAKQSVLGVRRGEEGDYYLGGDSYGFYCQFYLDKTAGEGALVVQNRMMAWKLSMAVAKAVRGGSAQ